MFKTQFADLLDLNLGNGFVTASRLIDIREQANRIAKQANAKQIANGEFATMFADNIKNWMSGRREGSKRTDFIGEAEQEQRTYTKITEKE